MGIQSSRVDFVVIIVAPFIKLHIGLYLNGLFKKEFYAMLLCFAQVEKVTNSTNQTKTIKVLADEEKSLDYQIQLLQICRPYDYIIVCYDEAITLEMNISDRSKIELSNYDLEQSFIKRVTVLQS